MTRNLKMSRFLKRFLADEAGAVTVDWVVLASVVIGLAIAVLATVSDGTQALSGELNDTMIAQDISTTF